MLNFLNNFKLALTKYSEVIFVTTSTTGWWWWGENALELQLWVRVGDGIIDPFSMVCSASMITNGYLPTIHSMAMAGLNKTNCHSINNDGKVKKKTSTIPTSKSSPFPLPFSCPSIKDGKMRRVRGLCHVSASIMARWELLKGSAMGGRWEVTGLEVRPLLLLL